MGTPSPNSPGAVWLADRERCPHQGFRPGPRFHHVRSDGMGDGHRVDAAQAGAAADGADDGGAAPDG